MTRQPGRAHHRRQSMHRPQQGFLLVQLSIFVAVLSIVLGFLGYQYWQKTVRGIADDRARLVGNTLGAINDATKTYMTTFFTQIQRGQSVTLKGHTVPSARVRTPSTADLQNLGMLSPRFARATVYNGVSIEFSIAISFDLSSGCAVPTCNLHSLVISNNPMVDPRSGNVDVRRATLAAVTASSSHAGVSLPANIGGEPDIFVSQDGFEVAVNSSGVAGLIAAANGYASEGFMEFDRRDGSLPRTGDINMQDVMGTRHSINEADAIGAQTVSTAGRLRTGEYLELDGPDAVAGQPCAKTGLVGKDSAGLILSCQSSPNGRVWKNAMKSGGTGIQGFMAPFAGMTASCHTDSWGGDVFVDSDANVSMNIYYRHYTSPVASCRNTTPCVYRQAGNTQAISLEIKGYGFELSSSATAHVCYGNFPVS